MKSVPPQPSSDPPKQVIINQLRKRIKRLEISNQALSSQVESLQSQASLVQSMQNYAEVLEAENVRLKAKNKWLKQQLLRSKRLSKKVLVTDKIQTALAEVGLKLNPTLVKTIQSVPEETVLTAIEALRQALTIGAIERPGGWLKRAIEQCWEPNTPLYQNTEVLSAQVFDQWFKLARSKGLVIASTKGENGKMYVFNHEGVQCLFEEMLAEYPIDSLIDNVLKNVD
jgi:hypothetical protein